MTDYSTLAPTQDDILESAIDSNKSDQVIPTESNILLSELRVPVNLDNFKVSVKSTEIAQPEPPTEILDLKPQANIDSILNGKLFDSMISPVTNFIENIKNVTNNYLGKNKLDKSIGIITPYSAQKRKIRNSEGENSSN